MSTKFKAALVEKASQNRQTEVTFGTIGWDNATMLDGQQLSNEYVNLSFAKNSGNNSPAFYTSGNGTARFYQNNSITVSALKSEVTITKIEFYAGSDNYNWSGPACTSGSFSDVSHTWTGSTSTVTITNISSSQVRLTGLSIYYTVQTDEPDVERLGMVDFRSLDAQWKVDLFKYGNVYAIPSPYAYAMADYIVPEEGSVADNLSTFFFYMAPNISNGVNLNTYYTGMTYGEGYTYLVSRSVFEESYGSGTVLSDPAAYGELKDNVVIFKAGSILALIADEEGQILDVLGWNDPIYIQLPGGNISSVLETEPETMIYVSGVASNFGNEPLVVEKSNNGNYEFDCKDAEFLNVSTNWDPNDDEVFFADMIATDEPISGEKLGKELPLMQIRNSIVLPWKGNYHVVISSDLSKISFSTTSSAPKDLQLALNSSKLSAKFTANTPSEYSLTLPEEITSSWTIGDTIGRYNFGYSGSINANGIYQLTPGYTSASIPMKKGDVLTLTVDPTDYSKPATLKITSTTEPDPSQPGTDPSEGKSTTVNDIVYTYYSSNNLLTVTDGSKAKGNVNLLESLDGHMLSSISDGAFEGNSSITSVSIPNGVIRIGNNAFKGCEFLKSVVLPDKLTQAGDYSFAECSYLSEVTLPVDITSLGTGMFANCTDLVKIEFLGEKVTNIPSSFATGCERLREVILPESLLTIGMSAFQNTSLTDIGLLPELTTINSNAFANSKLNTFDFGPKLTEIGSGAFAGSFIREITLPASLKTLEAEAFKGCPALSEVDIPASITSISNSTFEGCPVLHIVHLPNSITSIGEKAFANTGVVNITLPETTTELGASCFSTPTLMSITLGSKITSLSSMPIYTEGMLRINATEPPLLGKQRLGCTPTIVIVPKGCGDKYKSDSRWNEYNIIEEGSSSVTVYVEEEGKLSTSVREQSGLMPAKVTNLKIVGKINDKDFSQLRSNFTACYDIDLSRIENTIIPAKAFNDKKILTRIVLPSKLSAIEDDAFAGCRLLEVESMPSTLQSIGDRAFKDCNSMSGALTLPASVTTIGAEAFDGCYSLPSINLSSTKITEIAENTFAKTLSMKSASMPSTLKTVGENSFNGSGLSSIILNNGLTEIGASAFENCTMLTNISLPESIETIGARAFASSGLVYISFPSKVEEIEAETLADCPSLLIINLPVKLSYLGSKAIASSSVTAISSPAAEPAMADSEPFKGINNYTCGLSINGRSYSKYLNAEYWGAFVEMRNNIDVEITDENTDVTYIYENDYQSLIKDDALSAPGMRAAAMRVLKSNAIATASKGYGRVFDGAKLFCKEQSSVRYFVNTPSSVPVKVFYNDVDVTKQLDPETMSFVAPPFDSSASLRVEADWSSISSIVDDMSNQPTDVYNMQGILVVKSANQNQINSLPSGYYIIGGKKVLVK